MLVHRLAHRVAQAKDAAELYSRIIDAMTSAVNARIGALAVPLPPEHRLAIVATSGYRRELVEHLRIEPGAGILGAVYESGRTLHVTGTEATIAGQRRRLRYHTDSFIAVPIKFARQPLAVVSVADRRDNEAFTREDVTLLRALAAPAALGLSRERVLAEAERLAESAAIDPGSSLFNRRYLLGRLDEEIQRARRHGLSIALVMIDIDDFKTINDSFGHLAGDSVIRDVAQILRRSVRAFDVCARFGGEEFAILMPATSVASATKVAARIRERIESYRSAEPGLGAVRVTASLGLAVSSGGISTQDLISHADDALYGAKREGKNRLFVQTLDPSATLLGSESRDR
jgi:diguanylate cyclase (GGDEF)-like protein